MRPRFDPRSEACLTALTTGPGAGVREVGLVEALERADAFSSLAGATAGETVAVIEYLLALIHASRDVPHTVEEWQKWVTGRRPFERAATWLRDQPDADWDLFDPVRPLGQNADLAPFLDEHGVGPAQIVIEETGDYNQFFSHRHLHDPRPLPAGAAFRALLTQHAYGLQGRAMVKTGWLGPQLTYQSVARLGNRVRVLAVGNTLGETLRLNLSPGEPGPDDRLNRSWNDVPARRDFHRPKKPRAPLGHADAHSYLSRSILLRPVRLPDGSPAVDRVLLGSGEIWPEDVSGAFCQDAVLVRGRGGRKGEWVQLKPSPGRAMWREAHALYATVATRHRDRELYHRLACVPDEHIRLWAVGLIARQATAVSWIADEFPYVPGELEDLRQVSQDASAVCEYLADALGKASEAACAIVYRSQKPADRAGHRERFDAAPDLWAGAEEPFHAVMAGIAEGLDPQELMIGFTDRMARLASASLVKRLAPLPSHGYGQEARLRARTRLWGALRQKNAPAYLQENTHDPRS